MDCKTISTFRSLEQQAIKQYQINKIKEATYKGLLNVQEMPKQVINTQKSLEESSILANIINYLA